MLIRFKVSNFLSFKEETEFSMVAGRERLHPNHIVKGKKNQPNLLRVALLYGANAAGKSNFVKAIDFAKRRILKTNVIVPSRIFPFNPSSFRLDETYKEIASSFVFEFITNNTIYEYGFRIIGNLIQEEWLKDISRGKTLFSRKTNEKGNTKFEDVDYSQNISDRQFLKFVEKSIIPTQLFLTHSIGNNVRKFQKVYDWFDTSLNVIFPNTTDRNLEEKLTDNEEFKDFFTSFMQKAGTGISDVIVRPMKRKKTSQIKLRQGSLFKDEDKIIEEEEYETFLHMYLVHEGKKSDSIPLFSKLNESDGTQRLFDLMSPLYDLLSNQQQKVFIIDELERSLHANVSYMLLKSYLEQCHEYNSQLIATTHQTHLLDLNLLRRDEIWFAEKDEQGSTQLYSLYEFNPRYDKKIEKEYLTGRFGAIPFLGNFEFKKKLAKNGKPKK